MSAAFTIGISCCLIISKRTMELTALKPIWQVIIIMIIIMITIIIIIIIIMIIIIITVS